MMRFGLHFEFGFEFSQFLRVLLGKVNSLCGIFVQVVKLPGIFI